MTPRTEESLLEVPEDTRVFHIGTMKSGTTSLQRTIAQHRQDLVEHGVLYPGNAMNHRLPVCAFMGTRILKHAQPGSVGTKRSMGSADDPAIPSMDNWDSLLSELESTNWRKALISFETAAEASDAMAKKIVSALGDNTHIVISLRPLTKILPSFWAQFLKSSLTEPLDIWVARAIDDQHDKPLTARTRRAIDHGGLVERWASIVGSENVTVIIAESRDPDFIVRAFERILGLPDGFLAHSPTGGYESNRSLRLSEAELLRQINEVCVTNGVSWKNYFKLIRAGMVRRLLEYRVPRPDEPRVELPDWAIEQATTIGKDHARRIRASGVRVIGDLSQLHAPVDTNQVTGPENIPLGLALEAVAGVISASLGRSAFFSKPQEPKSTFPKPNQSGKNLADSYPARKLAEALRIQITRKLRNTRS